MNFLKSIVQKVIAFFSSAKAKAALETAASLVPLAATIVSEINVVVPNKTVTEVVAAYQKYGVPLTTTLASGDSTAIGNALLNLASILLQKNLPAGTAAVATNILNTAVQLAVTALKK
jgi:hypothetical protein